MEALRLRMGSDYTGARLVDNTFTLMVGHRTLMKIINHYDSEAKVGKIEIDGGQFIFNEYSMTTASEPDKWLISLIGPSYWEADVHILKGE